MALAERLRWPLLVMAIGQFMIFRRETYLRVGGHESVRTHAADDIALAQQLVARGGRWLMLDATNRVTCRMYHNFGQAFQGFSKNLYAAFGYNALAFLTIWAWLGFVFLAPPLLLLFAPPVLPLTAIVLAMLIWGLGVLRLRLPLALIILYPISIALTVIIAVSSVILTRLGKAKWKGRLLVAQR
jgi:chlorobactene glucosyltransferase